MSGPVGDAPPWRRLPLVPGLLFLLTMLSTLWVGAIHGLSFEANEAGALLTQGAPLLARLKTLLVAGAPFSVTIVGILLSHEMGHYLTARYYGLKTTLPHFIPFPSLVGTLGAFILIKSPFPHRRSLIDVGLAGPIAGFLVTIPALVIGIAQSRPGPLTESGMTLGEPLLFQWVSAWFWPHLPADQALYISPVGLAAWFGLLATALNLIPIGQLDGGHATYALLKERAHRVSRFAFLLLFPMAYFGPNWLVWAVLALVLGIRRPHPPTLWDETPLPRSRKIVGLAGYVIFVLCFTPEPVVFDWGQMFDALRGGGL